MLETLAIVIFVALLVFGATNVAPIADALGRALARLRGGGGPGRDPRER
jgi:Sec-independent protein translocase protein TatA